MLVSELLIVIIWEWLGEGWLREICNWLTRLWICFWSEKAVYLLWRHRHAIRRETAPRIAQLFRRWQYTDNCWKNGRCFHTKINQYTYEISSFSLLSLHVEKKISGSNSSQLLGNLVQKCLSSVANCWFDCIMFLKTCFFVLLLDCTLFRGKY